MTRPPGFGSSDPPSVARTALLTVLTLVAFAANSLLCRAALRPHLVDAATFTSVRLSFGALALAFLARKRAASFEWGSAAVLFAYAISFSFAYLRLDAGVGALVLFGSVQVTMIGAGIVSGHHPTLSEWVGLVVSLSGLVVLTHPGVGAPSLIGVGLMSIAGAAWGVYSLRGRGAKDPVSSNAGAFLLSLPMAFATSAVFWPSAHVTKTGTALAAISGGLTSGVGYVVWYAALRGLTPARAAIVQLAVPVIAAIGGILFLGESLSARLCWAAVLVLGGVFLAVIRRR